jgi:hypothetical protein
MLVDHIAVVRDYASADSNVPGCTVSAAYGCAPHDVVKTYQRDGYSNSLILLDETRKRGDTLSVVAKRDFVNSFLEETEFVRGVIAYRTRRHRIVVTFPADRAPRNITLASSADVTAKTPLATVGLPDGRQQVTFEKTSPKVGLHFTISWDWDPVP